MNRKHYLIFVSLIFMFFCACVQEDDLDENGIEGTPVYSREELEDILIDPENAGVYALIQDDDGTFSIDGITIPKDFTINLYGSFAPQEGATDSILSIGGILVIKSGSQLTIDDSNCLLIGVPYSLPAEDEGEPAEDEDEGEGEGEGEETEEPESDETVANALGFVYVDGGGTLNVYSPASIKFAAEGTTVAEPLAPIDLSSLSICENAETGIISVDGSSSDCLLNLLEESIICNGYSPIEADTADDFKALANALFVVTNISTATTETVNDLIVQSGVYAKASDAIIFEGSLVVEGTLAVVSSASFEELETAEGGGTIIASASFTNRQLNILLGIQDVKVLGIAEDEADDVLYVKSNNTLTLGDGSPQISQPKNNIEIEGHLYLQRNTTVKLQTNKTLTILDKGKIEMQTGDASIPGVKIEGGGVIVAGSTMIGGGSLSCGWHALGTGENSIVLSLLDGCKNLLQSFGEGEAALKAYGTSNTSAIIVAAMSEDSSLIVGGQKGEGGGEDEDGADDGAATELPAIPLCIDLTESGNIILAGIDSQFAMLVLKGGEAQGFLKTGNGTAVVGGTGIYSDLSNTVNGKIKKGFMRKNDKSTEAEFGDLYCTAETSNIETPVKLGTLAGSGENDAIIVSNNTRSEAIFINNEVKITGN